MEAQSQSQVPHRATSSLRRKMFVLIFSIVVISLITQAMYAISILRAEKQKFLYYAVLMESSRFGDKLTTELSEAKDSFERDCAASGEANEPTRIVGNDAAKLTEPERAQILRELTASKSGLKTPNNEFAILTVAGRFLVFGNSEKAQSCVVPVDTDHLTKKLTFYSFSNIYLHESVSKKNVTLVKGAAPFLEARTTLGSSQTLLTSAMSSSVSQGAHDFISNEGKDQVGSFLKILGGKYVVLTELPRESLTAELQSIAVDLLLFAVFLGALCLFVAVAFARRLSVPLELLKEGTDALAAGRYDQKLVIESNDEIEELAGHFSRLATRLLERDQQLEAASELATRDGLTGLRNYRYFRAKIDEYLALAIRHRLPIGVILLDLDHFKQVNDTYGHQQGDLVLKTISALVVKTCRETDVVCRYGGEEFIILAPQTSVEGAIKLAERIRIATEQTEIQILTQPGKMMKKTTSIGVCCFNPDPNKKHHTWSPDVHAISEVMIKEADTRLYEAKTTGRNQVKTSQTDDSTFANIPAKAA
jgi:diguanylate cyclase (GGDEF)-like protein